MRRRRGQALVEFVVIFPLLLLLIVVAIEAGSLPNAYGHQQRATATVAGWAAQHPGEDWHAVAEHELPGCTVDITHPLPGIVEATAHCTYHPIVFTGWDLLPMSSRESAPEVVL